MGSKPFSINGVEMTPVTFSFSEKELAILKVSLESYLESLAKSPNMKPEVKLEARKIVGALAKKFGADYLITPYTSDDADRDLTNSLA